MSEVMRMLATASCHDSSSLLACSHSRLLAVCEIHGHILQPTRRRRPRRSCRMFWVCSQRGICQLPWMSGQSAALPLLWTFFRGAIVSWGQIRLQEHRQTSTFLEIKTKISPHRGEILPRWGEISPPRSEISPLASKVGICLRTKL